MRAHLEHYLPIGNQNKNIRFWDYVGYSNRYIKITLKPGQTLTHHGGGPTDEGYFWWANEYTYKDRGVAGLGWEPMVKLAQHSGGRDCDGPSSSSSIVVSSLDKLADRHPRKLECRCGANQNKCWTENQVLIPWVHEERCEAEYIPKEKQGESIPRWVEIDAWQRDHYAESMGY